MAERLSKWLLSILAHLFTLINQITKAHFNYAFEPLYSLALIFLNVEAQPFSSSLTCSFVHMLDALYDLSLVTVNKMSSLFLLFIFFIIHFYKRRPFLFIDFYCSSNFDPLFKFCFIIRSTSPSCSLTFYTFLHSHCLPDLPRITSSYLLILAS